MLTILNAISADDPAGLFNEAFKAATSGKYGLLTVLLVLGLVAGMRYLGGSPGAKKPPRVSWLKWTQGKMAGWALNALMSVLVVIGGGMAAGGAFTWALLQTALLTAMATAGAVEAIKDKQA